MGLLDVPYQIYIFVAKIFGLFFLFVHGILFRMWNYGVKPALSKEDAKSLGDVSAMSVVEHAAKLPIMAFVLWWNLVMASWEAIFRPLNVTIARFNSLLWGQDDPETSNSTTLNNDKQG